MGVDRLRPFAGIAAFVCLDYRLAIMAKKKRNAKRSKPAKAADNKRWPSTPDQIEERLRKGWAMFTEFGRPINFSSAPMYREHPYPRATPWPATDSRSAEAPLPNSSVAPAPELPGKIWKEWILAVYQQRRD